MKGVAFAGCRGWLHEGASARGVLICPAWGFEELCSRSAMAWLAERLAAAGASVLRFDFRGTADSCDDFEESGRLDAWRADVRAAAAFLREACGATDLTLIGFRTGASLAAELARSLEAERLVLLASVVSGKAFLRELRAFARIARQGGAGGPWTEGVDAGGFELSRENQREIAAIDLSALRERPCQSVLILEQANGALEPFASCLKDLSIEPQIAPFVGYEQMMCDPTASQAPIEALEMVVRWIGETPPRASSPSLPARVGRALEDGAWIEEPLALGAALTAIHTRPKTRSSRCAALFLNAGAIHHVGWARMNVMMARDLAALGVASVRLDGGGIGDSAPFGLRTGLFAPARRAEAALAIDWLCSQGIEEVLVVGGCSGAHHALHLACEDRRVGAVVLINLVCVSFGPTHAMQLRAWQASKSAEMQARGLSAMEEGRTSLATMAAIALPLARRFAKSSFGALKTLSGLAAMGLGKANVFEQKLRELAERDVSVSLFYSEGDAALQELARYMGPGGERLADYPNVEKLIIPDADHNLTPPHAREALARLVERVACERAERLADRAPEEQAQIARAG